MGRRAEAVDVAYAAIEDAKRVGLEAVYGNFLAGNVADSLFMLGRWPEARAMSSRAMSLADRSGSSTSRPCWCWRRSRSRPNAGEEASRLLGQTVLELAAVREPQLAGPYYLAAASFALWRGDVSDASRSVDRGWASVRETEEWVLVAWMAAMVAQVDAAAAAEARHHRQLAPLASARQRTADVLATAIKIVRASGAPKTAGSRQVAEAWLATARAYQRRLEGKDDGHALAGGGRDMGDARRAPYDVALARWREAEAYLGSGTGRTGRAKAQEPLAGCRRPGHRARARSRFCASSGSWPGGHGSPCRARSTSCSPATSPSRSGSRSTRAA